MNDRKAWQRRAGQCGAVRGGIEKGREGQVKLTVDQITSTSVRLIVQTSFWCLAAAARLQTLRVSTAMFSTKECKNAKNLQTVKIMIIKYRVGYMTSFWSKTMLAALTERYLEVV